ncbi:MAG: ribosome small subunit-dependent GTPase A [Bacteroidaceae bacterium]|jgi:ribosome biogenesis GTPase
MEKEQTGEGLIIRNTGSWYQVLTQDGKIVDCKIKGNFRLRGIRSTNPVAVGDHVFITGAGDNTALITEIRDRKNYIIRKASNLSKQSHILAANVDLSLLMVTVSRPETSTTFIDRFLASAEAYNVPVVILFNKIDELSPEEEKYLQGLVYLYETIGYKCLRISALKEEGIAELQDLIAGKITLLSGHSGVGKSTLLNALIPGVHQKTAAISETHQSGMHTTTFSEMFPLPQGGYLIDTPGIKGFGTFDFEKEEVGHYFPEIFRTSAHCRFNNCTHRNEPGCAVLKAIEEHQISISRYNSYLSILDDQEESKYR